MSWLLGAPFYVQVIEGAATGSCRLSADRPTRPPTAGGGWIAAGGPRSRNRPTSSIAHVSGDPAGTTSADLARALACAARVVRPDGVIALLL